MTAEPNSASKDSPLAKAIAWLKPHMAQPGEDRTLRDALVIYGPTLAFFALVTMRTPQLVRDSDTYWHLVAGQWMFDHHAILRADPFSYTYSGRPWIAEEWLGELLMAFVFRHLSWAGLDLLVGVVAGITAFLLARLLLRYLQPVPAVLIQQLALIIIVPELLARPFVFMLPILAAWTSGLVQARDEHRAPRWWLLGLMPLWANVNSSSLLGTLLVGFFGLEAALEAGKSWFRAFLPWALFTIAAILFSLVTPFGVGGLLFPFKIMSSRTILSHIVEWQTSVFVGISPLEIAMLSLLFFAFLKPVRIPLPRLLLLLLFLHETLQHRRYEYILAIVGSMILAKPIAGALVKDNPQSEPTRPPFFVTASAAVVAIAIAAIRLAIPADPGNWAMGPVSAVAHVPKVIAQEHVLNDYNLGGYLIFKGIPTFIDDRTDFYGDNFVEQDLKMAFRPDVSLLRSTLAKYKTVWTIFPTDSPVNDVLDLLGGWRVLYKDQYAIVHVRADAWPARKM